LDSFEPFQASDLRHISVRSYRLDGRAVATPVWYVAEQEQLYFRTVEASLKVARIRLDPRVDVAPCTHDGTLTGAFVAASAQILVAEAPEIARIDALMDAKYGAERAAMTQMMRDQHQALVFISLRLRTERTGSVDAPPVGSL
jgi:PPOX class probable F420-dependent enzyme